MARAAPARRRAAALARGDGARGRAWVVRGSGLLLRRGRADAEHVPVVPVQIPKASPVEEALIIRLIRGQGTRREGLAGELIDALPAVDLQLQDRLARGGGIRDLLPGHGLELRLLDEQHVDVIADDEGLHGLARQPLVSGEANFGEEAG